MSPTRIECPHCGEAITLSATRPGQPIPTSNGPFFAVIEEIAKRYGVTVDDITGRSRTSFLVDARRDIASKLRGDHQLSLNHIGALLGGRDHTTIMSLLKRAGG